MGNYKIQVYQEGTTDEVGTGVLDGNYSVVVKDRDGNPIAHTVSNELIVPIVDSNLVPVTGTWDATNNYYIINGVAPIVNNIISNGVTLTTTLDIGDQIIANGVVLKTIT